MLIFSRTNCISTASGIVTLLRSLYSTQATRRLESSPSLCTVQSPKESDDIRCCTNTIFLLKIGTIALETCRHVEECNKCIRIKNLCIKLVKKKTIVILGLTVNKT